MPWQEYETVEQRMKFIAEYESAGGSFSALCARYEVSRMTGYKWWIVTRTKAFKDYGSARGHRTELGMRSVGSW